MASRACLSLLFAWVLIVSPACSAVRLKQLDDSFEEGQIRNDTREVIAHPGTAYPGAKVYKFRVWASYLFGAESVGLAAYHTSVTVDDHELVWGASGLHIWPVKVSDGSQRLVTHNATAVKEITSMAADTYYGPRSLIDAMRLSQAFTGGSYDFLRKNCNSFSDIATAWYADCRLPGYLNRLDNIGQRRPNLFEKITMHAYEANPEADDFDKEGLIQAIKNNWIRPTVEDYLTSLEPQTNKREAGQGQNFVAVMGAAAEAAVEHVMWLFGGNQAPPQAPVALVDDKRMPAMVGMEAPHASSGAVKERPRQGPSRPDVRGNQEPVNPRTNARAGAPPAKKQNSPSMNSVRIAAAEIQWDVDRYCRRSGANVAHANFEGAIMKRAQEIEKGVHCLKERDRVWRSSVSYGVAMAERKGSISAPSDIVVGIVTRISDRDVSQTRLDGANIVIPVGSAYVEYYEEFVQVLRAPGTWVYPREVRKVFSLRKGMKVWAFSNSQNRWRRAQIMDFAPNSVPPELYDKIPHGSVNVKFFADESTGESGKWVSRDEVPVYIAAAASNGPQACTSKV